VLFGDARERMHQVFGGANTRGRHKKRRMASDVRLDRAHVHPVDNSQALYAVALALFHQGEKLFLFGSIFRDDKLSRGAVRHVVPGAKFLAQAIAFDAVARFPGIPWIVNSGMDHPAIARARGHPKFWILLNKKNILPPARERFRDCATDNTASNNQNICLVHIRQV
jgi:hypothetical protein